MPLLVPLIVALVHRAALRGHGPYALPTVARILGYPALLVLWLVVPWLVLVEFFVPVMLDAYPGSRAILAAPLALSHAVAPWSLMAAAGLWPVWVVVAALHGARRTVQAPR